MTESFSYSFRGFLDHCRQSGHLKIFDRSISRDLEVASLIKKHDGGPILLFKKIKGFDIPVVANVLATRERVYSALNAKTNEEAYSKLLNACANPLKVGVKPDAPFQEIIENDLSAIPILRYYPRDAGYYITSGIVIARDPERPEILNASYHRLLFIDKQRLAIRVVPRHLYAMMSTAFKRGHDLDVAIVIGCSPAFLMSAAASPPYGIFELEVANRIADGKLEACLLPNQIPVPRDAEIVIEGRILKDKEIDEGPFVDILGLYDKVRKQPIVEVTRVYRRENSMYYAILPAGLEHINLMSFYREALIWDSVRRVVPKVYAVRLTRGSGGWLHCVISIEKQTDGDAKNAILAAFAAHPSLKLVVVVDKDIDVDNPYEVEWAIATRFQASRDLVIIRGVRGSSLDPSADTSKLLTDKVGIDATKPLDKPAELFERASLPDFSNS